MAFRTEYPENCTAHVETFAGLKIVEVKKILYWEDQPIRIFTPDGYKYKICEEPFTITMPT